MSTIPHGTNPTGSKPVSATPYPDLFEDVSEGFSEILRNAYETHIDPPIGVSDPACMNTSTSPTQSSADVPVFTQLSQRKTVYFVILLITYMIVMCLRKHMQNNERRYNHRIAFRLDNCFSLAAVAICVWLYHELTQAALIREAGEQSQLVLDIWEHVFVGFFRKQRVTVGSTAAAAAEMETKWGTVGLAVATCLLHVPLLEYQPSIFGIGWRLFYAVDLARWAAGIALQCRFLLHVDESVKALVVSYTFLSQFTYIFILDHGCTGGGMFHVFNPVKAACAVYDYTCSLSEEMGVKLATRGEKIPQIYHLAVAGATSCICVARVLKFGVPTFLGDWTNG